MNHQLLRHSLTREAHPHLPDGHALTSAHLMIVLAHLVHRLNEG